MPGKLLLSTLALCILASVSALAAPRDIIPAGTLLQCTLDEPNLSSKTALVGDPILCHLGTLGSFGHSILPRGAMLGGHLQDYKDPGRFFGKGWIQLEFDRMVLPGAEILPLSAKVISAPHMKVDAQGSVHGKGHPTRDAVEWAIPVFWPIKILTLPARGPYPTFKGETRISLRLMEDVEVPFSTAARNSVPMPPWATPNRYHSSSYDSAAWQSQTAPVLATRPSPAVEPAYYSQRVEPAPQLPAQAAPTTIIALNDGSAVLAREYWIQGGQMHCVSSDSQQRAFPLEKIDLDQTVRVNRERNVDFVLQSRDPVEQ